MKSKYVTRFSNSFIAKLAKEWEERLKAQERKKNLESLPTLEPVKSPMDYLREAAEREKEWGFRDKK